MSTNTPSELTIQLNLIEHAIKHHQYISIYTFLQQNSHWQDKNTLDLVGLAHAIVKGNLSAIEKLAPLTGYQFLTQPSYIEQRSYNFWHYLTIQLSRQEYADYLRALTPLLVDIYRIIIQRHLLPNLNHYIEPTTKVKEDGEALYRGLQWSQTAIEAKQNMVHRTFQHYYGDRFNYSHYISSSHLLKIIEFNSKDDLLIEKAHDMRNIEKYLRNIVAHEIIYVDDDWIQARVGRSPASIHQLLKDLYHMAGLNDENQWQSLATLDDLLTQRFNERYIELTKD
ncbi:hypothetical protein [Fundicoccus culcitae]|uniref:Csm6 HEPN domain-containing protein n=1 Tax=Fundicoccus culcitae TaxID=2969821 RepID=A0ABY5P389_9LACT|nr:hypothetical protein [Fundicoccus culcitae]UUX33191.1 hypothetical protein NRE15_09790 [Fundicoccus culcitae]